VDRFGTKLGHAGRKLVVAVMAMVLTVVLTGCGGGGDDSGSKGTIRIGLIPWDEAIAVTNLWQALLEERGYEVEQIQLEAGGLYSGVANGDLDLFLDAWLPATHADYWEQFGDDIEDVGTWFDSAPLTWVVPGYVEDVNSIADLEGRADTFGGRIIGIEAGSGLMRISREEVVPAYGLEEYQLVEGSTPAMLAELEKAIADEEPIVVTLWQPHFAYGQWDLKNLEDPEGALGEPDEIRSIASEGFVEEHPEVAGWIRNFQMDNDALAELEVAINEAGAGKELEATKRWLEDNRDLVEPWFEG
jgi:glycine betaine/proline transport system substrate-binding protein